MSCSIRQREKQHSDLAEWSLNSVKILGAFREDLLPALSKYSQGTISVWETLGARGLLQRNWSNPSELSSLSSISHISLVSCDDAVEGIVFRH